MRPLTSRPSKLPGDPAPSRWAWRLERLLLTPAFLLLLRAGLPILAVVAAVLWYFSDPARVQVMKDAVAEARADFEARPEFTVHMMEIDGAGNRLSEEIRNVLPLIFPASSFDLDLPEVRKQVIALDPVKAATVRIKPGGVLQVEVTPRVPVLIWRHRTGLSLLDENGALVRALQRRTDRADLPIVAGDSADKAVAEALALFAAASPLSHRLRGLERVGARRWDVVLDRDQRLLLPEKEAVQALERVITLDAAQDILSRDLQRVDMRLGMRPTVQMSAFATGEWWSTKQGKTE
ncbi:MAG: cell division protein FtsQ/DivIB [Pseudomonadota bacterium]